MSSALRSHLDELAGDLYHQLQAKLGSVPEFNLDTERLLTFAELLKRWTERMDLIAPAPLETIIENHIIDSIAALTLAEFGSGKPTGYLDIGSGAGLPGVVIAIQRRSSPIVLVEPREKRCVFLKEARRVLELQHLQVSQRKIEEVEERGGASMAITRAVGMEELLLSESRRLELSELVLMVGPSWDGANSLPGERLIELPYTLPRSGAIRRVIIGKCVAKGVDLPTSLG